MGKSDAIVRVRGGIREMETDVVQPYFRLGRERAFRASLVPAKVVAGSFTWQRITSKRITFYVSADGKTSNRHTIPRE